jgi:hypothetical protein
MSEEIEFVNGLIVKKPHEKAPDFVKASISIKVADLGMWLREKHKAGEEWVNVDVKESRGGKWYAAVSTFKPKEKQEQQKKGGNSFADMPDDIPFQDPYKFTWRTV